MGNGLGTLLPILGGVQWISGLVLAVAALRRARAYGSGGGTAARVAARLAIFLFILAALDLLLRATGASVHIANYLPEDFDRETWHVRALLIICGGAWLLLLVAASVNASLGVGERRRSAAEELRRRMGGRRTPYQVAWCGASSPCVMRCAIRCRGSATPMPRSSLLRPAVAARRADRRCPFKPGRNLRADAGGSSRNPLSFLT